MVTFIIASMIFAIIAFTASIPDVFNDGSFWCGDVNIFHTVNSEE